MDCSGPSATAGFAAHCRQPPPALPAAAVPSRAHAAMAGSDPLLQVQNLSRSFGGLRAVSEVSFTVARGEILGIIGPNGAGKTTLFNVLNGVLPADDGSATLAGESMLGRKVHQVCRMGVGRTFQVVRSFPRLPLLDNVVVGAYGAGLSDQRRYGGGGTAHCAASACCSSRRGRLGSSPTSSCG